MPLPPPGCTHVLEAWIGHQKLDRYCGVRALKGSWSDRTSEPGSVMKTGFDPKAAQRKKAKIQNNLQ